MKVQSTIQPDEIEIDRVRNGRARLLVHWDIQEITYTDEMTGESQTMYEYNETTLWWTFPLIDSGVQLDNITTINQYIQNNKAEILNFAKATEVSL
jgi:hypothetical protein